MNYDSQKDTINHILTVRSYLDLAASELIKRGEDHDKSKLGENEKPYFDKLTPILKDLNYGSDDYKKALDDLKPALDHHYKENSHHPEHYKNGINGMNLFDLIEMFFDWKAASERHENGDINKSIEINKKRFNMSNQLVDIFNNTIEYLNWEK